MLKKFLVCLLFLPVTASPTEAKPYLWSNYICSANIRNYTSDYSRAKFDYLYLEITDERTSATQKLADLKGIMTIWGVYSVIDGNKNVLLKVSDNPISFRISANMNVGDKIISYVPVDGNRILYFLPENGTGLNGVRVSWEFSDMPEFNGSAEIPKFKSVREQILKEPVPFFSVINSNGKFSEIRYGLSRAKDTSRTLTPNEKTDIRIYADFTDSSNNFWMRWLENYNGKMRRINPEKQPPINDLEQIRIRLRKFDSDMSYIYQWNYLR